MPHTFEFRISNLERVALQSEGSQFALRDCVARLFLKAPDTDIRALVAELLAHAETQRAQIGTYRLAGYRDELEALAEEMEAVQAAI